MKSGFSLVELSIVLVILGLLTGGILAGQSLIRAAELRSVSTEYQRYTTAIGAFRDKYFQLPGDMTNATSFWAASATCPGLSGTAAAGVCNGDGNGALSSSAAASHEPFGFWEHLAMAGLVEGTYSGNTGHASTASDNSSVPGTNSPRSKLNNGSWAAYYLGSGSVAISDTTWFEGTFNNFFFFGSAPSGNLPLNAVLKPEEAWNIDTKLDDGKPATGSIVSLEAQGTSCSDLAASNSASRAASVYLLSGTSVTCSFMMKTGY